MEAKMLKFLIIFLFLETKFFQVDGKRESRLKDSVYPEGSSGHTENDNGSSATSVPRCRHNYHDSTEVGMNRQVNMFLQAGFVYDSMSQYFGRCDVALSGFSKFFNEMAKEQQEKAQSLQKYQNLRGGVVHLQPITTPATANWGSGLEAMSHALEMEKSINAALLELHALCSQVKDPHAASFLQTAYIGPQVEKIYKLSQYISNLERVGPGIGEYLFDKLPQS